MEVTVEIGSGCSDGGDVSGTAEAEEEEEEGEKEEKRKRGFGVLEMTWGLRIWLAIENTEMFFWQNKTRQDSNVKGKLSNGMVVCDVSGSMNGMPMEVSVALGVLLSDLSKAPWKGEGYYLKSDIEIDRSIVRLHGRLTLQIKFWNLKDSGSTPVPATRKGVALVLGPRW
ncbi:hypothetical protein V6N12_056053 [Hibiscus sabdariffa]|uniref:DUF7788 domain-containing protein n=1 Tax=Hibiscus sabdariffa TaxID=183260 RepID=A0ABR2CRD4_9ROSI